MKNCLTFVTVVVVLDTNTENVQHLEIKERWICLIAHGLRLKPPMKSGNRAEAEKNRIQHQKTQTMDHEYSLEIQIAEICRLKIL